EREIVGQMFQSGIPVSPARIYTSDFSHQGPSVVFGGGQFMVTYTRLFSFDDQETMGMMVDLAGVATQQFRIATGSVNVGGSHVTYLTDRDQYFVVFNKRPGTNLFAFQAWGAYVSKDTLTIQRSMLMDNGAALSVAYAPGNIAVVFSGNDDGGVFRGHMAPGESALREIGKIGAGGTSQPEIAFNPAPGVN